MQEIWKSYDVPYGAGCTAEENDSHKQSKQLLLCFMFTFIYRLLLDVLWLWKRKKHAFCSAWHEMCCLLHAGSEQFLD